MEKNENNQKSTLFYKIFENTLDSLKSNILTPKPPAKISILRESHNDIPGFEKVSKIPKIKKEGVKGLKLCYMLDRNEKEGVYMWI